MGTCYYLVKRGKKEYFDLNKSFYGLFPTDRTLELSKEYDASRLAARIMETVSNNGWTWKQPGVAGAFSTALALQLLSWAGEDETAFMSDTTFDSFGSDMDEFVETGNRFAFNIVKILKGEDDERD